MPHLSVNSLGPQTHLLIISFIPKCTFGTELLRGWQNHQRQNLDLQDKNQVKAPETSFLCYDSKSITHPRGRAGVDVTLKDFNDTDVAAPILFTSLASAKSKWSRWIKAAYSTLNQMIVPTATATLDVVSLIEQIATGCFHSVWLLFWRVFSCLQPLRGKSKISLHYLG